jgi:hypothetical protein
MIYMLLCGCDGDTDSDIMIINSYLNEKQIELIEYMTTPISKTILEESNNDGICNDKENV